MDYSRFIYFLDGDGDVARKERALGGGKRSKAKAPKAPKAQAKAAAPSARGGKTSAQLDREIEECLARAKKEDSGAAAPTTPAKKPGRGSKKKAPR
jgi:hypothetical protein